MSSTTFLHLVKFIYSAQLSLNQENAIPLLKCSETFKMKNLQQDISDYLKLTVTKYSLKDIFQVFTLAHELNKQELKKECIRLIRLEEKIITYTAEWAGLLKNKPELLTEIMLKSEI